MMKHWYLTAETVVPDQEDEMSLSAFGEKAAVPDDDKVASVLGGAKGLWDKLKEHTARSYENVSEEWKFYSKAAGWTLAIKSGKRTLFYLIPQGGLFKAGFVFGDRALKAAEDADIPADVKKTISEAHRYAEGSSFMIDVKDVKYMNTTIELTGIKDRN
jgi:hypothetical protein